MDKDKLTKWLDRQAEIQKEMEQGRYFDDNICSMIGQSSKVHVTGALLICETLNIPFIMSDFSHNEYRAEEIAFEWNGVEFFGLENYRSEVD